METFMMILSCKYTDCVGRVVRVDARRSTIITTQHPKITPSACKYLTDHINGTIYRPIELQLM